MREAGRQFQNLLRNFWKGLRQWCGDSAYETYRACAKRRKGHAVLTPAEFYLEQLNRKYSRPNRCC